MFTSAAAFTLYGLVFGGAGAKFVELMFGKKKVTEDIARSLREELRGDIIRYRNAANEAEKELDDLREKYYEVLEANAQFKAALALQNHKVYTVAAKVDEAHPETETVKELKELPE